MATAFETDIHGTTREWDIGDGQCPKCGAPCSMDFPVTPDTPKRILCGFCGYREGYRSINPAIKSNSAEYRDGYDTAREYVESILRTVKTSSGAPYQMFCEAVAFSILRKEKIAPDVKSWLSCLLENNYCEFHLGVYNYLLEKIQEYEKCDPCITRIEF